MRIEGLSLIWSLTIAMALALPTVGFAQGTAGSGPGVVSGKDEYKRSCSECHGPVGKPELKGFGAGRKVTFNKPTDLTLLAHYNHGVFPEERVRAMIDGTTKVKGAHAARLMPVWGREFLKEGSSPEEAQARVNALIDYLKSIQEK